MRAVLLDLELVERTEVELDDPPPPLLRVTIKRPRLWPPGIYSGDTADPVVSVDVTFERYDLAGAASGVPVVPLDRKGRLVYRTKMVRPPAGPPA